MHYTNQPISIKKGKPTNRFPLKAFKCIFTYNPSHLKSPSRIDAFYHAPPRIIYMCVRKRNQN